MKRIWFFLFILITSLLAAIQPPIITKPLIEVFEYFQLPHDGTEKSLAALAKQHWSRKHKERWEMTPITVKTPDKLMRLFEQIGLIQSVYPKHKHYDYVLILGAQQTAVQKRLDFLKELEAMGCTYDKIALLGSTVQLDKNQNTVNAKDEADLLEKMYHKKKPYILIRADYRPDGKRANTADTLRFFLQREIKPHARILAISSQPYVLYQDRVVQHVLKDFQAETVGSKATTKNIIAYLEAISSYLNPVLD